MARKSIDFISVYWPACPTTPRDYVFGHNPGNARQRRAVVPGEVIDSPIDRGTINSNAPLFHVMRLVVIRQTASNSLPIQAFITCGLTITLRL